MRERDLKTFAELGGALCSDPSQLEEMVVETLSAVSLLDLTEERALEKAATALYERALKQGMAASTRNALEAGTFGNPYYRLFPEERFLLAALHLGRWSYARISRVMNKPIESVEAMAWKARARLGTQGRILPIGAKAASANCPEYDLDRPWTQRFLDEEIPNGRDFLFLQNHLMACESCLLSLSRCRDLYFFVEGLLPRSEEKNSIVPVLEKVLGQGRFLRSRGEITFTTSLLAFLKKPDVQVILAITFFCLLAAIFRHR